MQPACLPGTSMVLFGTGLRALIRAICFKTISRYVRRSLASHIPFIYNFPAPIQEARLLASMVSATGFVKPMACIYRCTVIFAFASDQRAERLPMQSHGITWPHRQPRPCNRTGKLARRASNFRRSYFSVCGSKGLTSNCSLAITGL